MIIEKPQALAVARHRGVGGQGGGEGLGDTETSP